MAEDADSADDKAALFAAKRAKRRPAPEIDATANPTTVPIADPGPESIAADEVADVSASAPAFQHVPPPSDEPAAQAAVEAPLNEARHAETPHAETQRTEIPPTETPAADPIVEPPLKRTNSFGVPLAIGLVVGAGAAVAGAYAIQALGLFAQHHGATSQTEALQRRLDGLEQKLATTSTLGPRIDALAARVAALPMPPDTSVLDKRIAALEAAPSATPEDKSPPAPTVDLAPLNDRLGALESKVAALPSAADIAARVTAAAPPQDHTDVLALGAKVDGLATRMAPLEALAAPKTDVRAPQDREGSAGLQAARGPDLAIVAADLARKISGGKPFEDDLALLGTLGADAAKIGRLRPFAASGVTTAADLATQFAPLAGTIIASGEPVRDESFLAHLERSAGGLVRVQKVDGESGDDLAARVARLQAALARGNVAAAVALWRGLPAAGKAKSDAWGRAAGAHADALDVAQALQSDAIALIGKGRS